MNILVVTQYYSPENFRINDVVDELVKKGHNITVLTGCPNYPEGTIAPGFHLLNPIERASGRTIIRVPIVPRGKNNPIQLATNYISYAFTASIAALFLSRSLFDVIFVCQLSPITTAFPAMIFRTRTKTPLAMWVLDLWPESALKFSPYTSKFLEKLLEAVVRMVYRNCDLILFSSKEFLTSITKRTTNPVRLRYFPNWYEESTIEEDKVTQNLPAGFRIMYTGNIGEAQDFDTLIETATLLRHEPDIKWVIIGDGRDRERVESQIRQKNLSDIFHFLGRHPPAAMPGFWAQADILTLALTNDPAVGMTVPGKVQSYLGSGVPIAAALNGEGLRIINDSKSGFATKSGDAQALAESILKLMRMTSKERRELGRNGKVYAGRHFNRAVLIDDLEEQLKRLASNK